jgi:hypothetical protein
MLRARCQAGKPQAVEQIVHASERILDCEFLLENPLGIFRSQRADPIGIGGFSQEPFFERSFFRRRQVRGPTGLSLGNHAFEAVIPIPVDPPLHKSPAAAQHPSDPGSIVTFDGQENSSIAISLFGIPLMVTFLTQSRQILSVMKLHLHPTDPPVFPRVCQITPYGATLF